MSARSSWPPSEAAQVDYETRRAQVLEPGGAAQGLFAARFARRGLVGLIAWHAAEPHTMVNTGNCAAVRTCPPPTGTSRSGNQKLHWAISPPAKAVCDTGSGGEYTGRNSATRAESTRIGRVQPIR